MSKNPKQQVSNEFGDRLYSQYDLLQEEKWFL